MSAGKARPNPLKVIDEPETIVRRELGLLVEQINKFGQLVADRIGDQLRKDPASLRAHVAGTRFLFQKWNLEMLYLLALFDRLRFGELQRALPGISSRTLSLKLADLEKAGFVNRDVVGDRPLRVEYSVAPAGRIAARLAIPLVMHLATARPRFGT